MAASAAALAIQRIQAAGVTAETKPDDSPVTAADRASERVIVEALAREFPNDGVLGEEGAKNEGTSGRRWIIDPIDGTKDFVRGNPLWAVMIGLEQDGEMVAGVVSFPALQRMYSGARGLGAFLDDTPIRASAVAEVSQAVLCVNQLNAFVGHPLGQAVFAWSKKFWSVRGFGGAFDAMLVAAGSVDVYIEPKLAAWDLAGPKAVLDAAGAKFINFDGGSSIYAGNIIACAPGMEAEVRRFLGEQER
jgi:histidinol phosphatase-like enzyme (inositol monophosphatase family)